MAKYHIKNKQVFICMEKFCELDHFSTRSEAFKEVQKLYNDTKKLTAVQFLSRNGFSRKSDEFVLENIADNDIYKAIIKDFEIHYISRVVSGEYQLITKIIDNSLTFEIKEQGFDDVDEYLVYLDFLIESLRKEILFISDFLKITQNYNKFNVKKKISSFDLSSNKVIVDELSIPKPKIIREDDRLFTESSDFFSNGSETPVNVVFDFNDGDYFFNCREFESLSFDELLDYMSLMKVVSIAHTKVLEAIEAEIIA